jgi:Na+-driven multidrug efflux pump
LLRQVIVLIPLLFILPAFWELNGIWISMPISDFCSALIVLYFIRREWIRLSAAAKELSAGEL